MLASNMKVSFSFVKSILHPIRFRVIFSSVRHVSSAGTMKEQKINVDGIGINYVQVGMGKQPVLLLPGAMGTIWTDFKPQLEHLNKDKLTIVAWDPPGYGKSRPPNRKFTPDFLQKDATYAHNLMKTLGFSKFSLIGWSDGGISSLFMAANYPESVHKMIVIGANSYILPEELEIYKSVKDINTWSERMRAPLLEVYGEDYFRNTWAAWVDTMVALYNAKGGDICNDILGNIKCPTLIVHGKKDRMVDMKHPTHLKDHIANSRIKYFENGAHNLHLRYPDEFNQLAVEFLTE